MVICKAHEIPRNEAGLLFRLVVFILEQTYAFLVHWFYAPHVSLSRVRAREGVGYLVLSPVTDEICAGRLCRGRGRRSPNKSNRNRDSTLKDDGEEDLVGQPRLQFLHVPFLEELVFRIVPDTEAVGES